MHAHPTEAPTPRPEQQTAATPCCAGDKSCATRLPRSRSESFKNCAAITMRMRCCEHPAFCQGYTATHMSGGCAHKRLLERRIQLHGSFEAIIGRGDQTVHVGSTCQCDVNAQVHRRRSCVVGCCTRVFSPMAFTLSQRSRRFTCYQGRIHAHATPCTSQLMQLAQTRKHEAPTDHPIMKCFCAWLATVFRIKEGGASFTGSGVCALAEMS